MTADRWTELFSRLLNAYGAQEWWPGDDPLEVAVGAILTQHCSWHNAERALEGLRDASALSIEALRDAPDERMYEAIRAAGFYRSKTATLREFAERVSGRHGGRIEWLLGQPMACLREELLTIRGIGEETADAICLYAGGHASFVIDAYTRRLLERLGWIQGSESYAELRAAFMEQLPADAELFNEYHALIVRHAKEHCRARPSCAGCPVDDLCTVPDAAGIGGAP